MNESGSLRGYLLAAVLGAAGGALLAALATDAIPKILSRTMAGMMENRMSSMGGEGCDPEEM